MQQVKENLTFKTISEADDSSVCLQAGGSKLWKVQMREMDAKELKT